MATQRKTGVVILAAAIGFAVGIAVLMIFFAEDPKPDYATSFGAPPMIPHQPYTKEKCTDCHGPSTHAPELGVPTTGHPERSMCRQCHVPMRDTKLFVGNIWKKP